MIDEALNVSRDTDTSAYSCSCNYNDRIYYNIYHFTVLLFDFRIVALSVIFEFLPIPPALLRCLSKPTAHGSLR